MLVVEATGFRLNFQPVFVFFQMFKVVFSNSFSSPFIKKCCIILYHLFVPSSGGEVAVVCLWSPHSNVIHEDDPQSQTKYLFLGVT